jgi:hypothetical protein
VKALGAADPFEQFDAPGLEQPGTNAILAVRARPILDHDRIDAVKP